MVLFKRIISGAGAAARLSGNMVRLGKKREVLLALGMFAVVSLASAQSSQSPASNERSVEESYLQESVEIAIIREQSRSDSRDGQMVALEYISDAIENGNTSDEIRSALEYIGLEGVANVQRESGRVVNNFPDVRARAASYLGTVGTTEAKDSLLKMLLVDNEPWVLTETVKSLAKIGINDDEETVMTIAWIIRRYDAIGPNNPLAIAALDAFDSFAKNNNGLKDFSVVQAIILIRDGRYIRPVQEKARTVLSNIRKYSSQAKTDKQS
jgi:hypothetical protein